MFSPEDFSYEIIIFSVKFSVFSLDIFSPAGGLAAQERNGYRKSNGAISGGLKNFWVWEKRIRWIFPNLMRNFLSNVCL